MPEIQPNIIKKLISYLAENTMDLHYKELANAV
jgi:hypothetical protein